MKRLIFLLTLGLGIVSTPAQSGKAPNLPAGYKEIYTQKFADASTLHDFVFSDPTAWRWTNQPTGNMELFGDSHKHYEPKYRSPWNIALLKDRMVGDFVLDVKLLSTKAPYPHQDMCVFFGFQDTNHYYYSHIAVLPDPHAHNVFIVNDAERLALDPVPIKDKKGVVWGVDEWHSIRVERKSEEGSIKVYYDDMTTPIFNATDKTFKNGYVGFGSFDDTGKVGEIHLYAPSSTMEKTTFFNSVP